MTLQILHAGHPLAFGENNGQPFYFFLHTGLVFPLTRAALSGPNTSDTLLSHVPLALMSPTLSDVLTTTSSRLLTQPLTLGTKSSLALMTTQMSKQVGQPTRCDIGVFATPFLMSMGNVPPPPLAIATPQ